MKKLIIIAGLLLSLSTFAQDMTVYYSQEGDEVKVATVRNGQVYSATAPSFGEAVKYLKVNLKLGRVTFSAAMTDESAVRMLHVTSFIFTREDDTIHKTSIQ